MIGILCPVTGRMSMVVFKSFHSFYYIIEDLYGGGKTRNRDVITEMKSFQELREIIQWAFERVADEPKHRNALQTLFDSEKLPFDVDGFNNAVNILQRKYLHHIHKAMVG